jgi:hypothetical protein
VNNKIIVQMRGNLGNQLYQFIAALELVNGDATRVLIDTRLCHDFGPYSLPLVISNEHLFEATPLDLIKVGEIPGRMIGFRTLSKLKNGIEDPFIKVKAECGWYGMYADAIQCRLANRDIRFIAGMFQKLDYYRNSNVYITRYAKPLMECERYDVVVSLRQGREYVDAGVQLGCAYYMNAFKQIDWNVVRKVAVTGDVLPSWDIFGIIPSGVVVDNWIGSPIAVQFSVLRNSDIHVMANSTFSWWATVFGQSYNDMTIPYVPTNWFTSEQVSFIGAICV